MATRLGRLDRVAYLAQQRAILYPLIGINRLGDLLVNRRGVERPDGEARLELRERFRALLDRDLENVRAGLYPKALLFQIPFGTYARTLPKMLWDLPRVLRRMRAGNHQDLPPGVNLDRYPRYYLRNFHWQTYGYFSRHSAQVYDLTVEFLFLGAADIMRRQVIPPISRLLAERGRSDAILLDIDCGTGRTIRQIATAHPALRLFGVDLSLHYLQVAREALAGLPRVSLAVENGESLPFKDGSFDVVTSVYLFHELPHEARRRVVAEAYRVLRPGGLLIIEDSIQVTESEKLAFFMGKFADDYHEPYYQEYLQDNFDEALREVGFQVQSVEAHYVSKVFVARK